MIKKRTIQFAAWNEVDKTLVQPQEVKRFFPLLWGHRHYHLLQLTGAKDIRGKDVIEGHVVKIDLCDDLKVVEWCDDSYQFVLRHLPEDDYSENYFLDEAKMEIVGLIFDYKETPQ